jgi:hypothetical protein
MTCGPVLTAVNLPMPIVILVFKLALNAPTAVK